MTSPENAILHTGDVRADPLFIQSLRRNPALAPFIAPLAPGPVTTGGGRRVLDRIYLDTSAMSVFSQTCAMWDTDSTGLAQATCPNASVLLNTSRAVLINRKTPFRTSCKR